MLPEPDRTFVVLVDVKRKTPILLPELGVAVKCERPDQQNPRNKDRVRVIVRPMLACEYGVPPKKGLTPRRQHD